MPDAAIKDDDANINKHEIEKTNIYFGTGC